MTTNHSGDGRAEALRLLGTAEQLLAARDLARSRSLAERALEADPLLDGPDRVLAIADVLLAAQSRRLNNHVDWYAVLQVDPSAAPSASVVRLHYRRLALLLRPDPRRGDLNLVYPVSSSFSFSSSDAIADEAFKLVCDAWAVLSDPTKKALYDKEIEMAADKRPEGGGYQRSGDSSGKKGSAEAEIDAGAAFWTACTGCCYVYQYAREYERRSLLCQNCGKAFQATEIATPPPVVPGTDLYFCAWGLFPLGFPGGPIFAPPSVAGSGGGRQMWRVGRKKKESSDEDADWMPRSAKKKQNQRSPVAKKGKANGRLVDENNVGKEAAGVPGTSERSPRRTRTKVMATRGKGHAAGAEKSKVVASGEGGGNVDPATEDGEKAKQGAEAKPDETKDPQKAGCSRNVEVSMEDLNLNFTIDVNAAAAIIESMGSDPGYNNLRWFEDCFRGNFNP